VRSLVYLFMAIVSLSAGAMVYFGLAFTPIEAGLLALVVALACWLGLEMMLRGRAESRLQEAIEDLTRLHARDAAANQELTARLDDLLGRDVVARLDVLEADLSVLGTVVRETAETMAALEARMTAARAAMAEPTPEPDLPPAPAGEPSPVIPPEMVAQAIDENRLVFHMRPIITLPQRRTHGYDLVPRLMLEDGELADPPDFMPRGHDGLVVRIERMLLETAVEIVRRARTSKDPVTLFVPLTGASLADEHAREQMLSVLEANRAICSLLAFTIDDEAFRTLAGAERDALEAIARKGAALCLDHATSLRREFPELARKGVKYLKVAAGRFLTEPQTLTDFHPSDVAAFLARSEISLVARDVGDEDQILSLLDDGVGFAEGDHIAAPSPIRTDLISAPEDEAPDLAVRRVNR
jgi:cyclic-di-GMP phosphodiesterase TipF (flagellum assembly factor)